MPATSKTRPWIRVAPYFSANVLFGAGLWGHAFLYNFYLDALGYDEVVMGLAAAALTAGGLTALAPAGLILDRFGARRSYLGAVLAGSVGLVLGAFAESQWTIYGAAFLAGTGAAAWRVTSGPVLIAITEGAVRSRAFSWNVALLVGSGALWTAVAGQGTEWVAAFHPGGELAGLRLMLAAGGLVTALAAPAFLLVVLGSTSRARTGGERRGLRSALASFVLPRRLFVFVAVVLIWMTAAGLVLPFFNVFFQRTYDMSVGDIASLFASVQIATAVALFGAGEMAGRMGPKAALIGWSLAFAPALWWLALAGPVGLAIGLYALAGVVPPATNPLIDQILLEEATPSEHGVASSWRNGATEMSGFLGASAGGFLLAPLGFGGLFVIAGGVALAGALALMFWIRIYRRPVTVSPDE